MNDRPACHIPVIFPVSDKRAKIKVPNPDSNINPAKTVRISLVMIVLLRLVL